MTEDEMITALAVHERREKAFQAAGLSYWEAFDLAEAMFDRDLHISWDHRKLCFECKNYKNRRCTAYPDSNGKPGACFEFVLQRCDKFEMKGKKHVE